MLALGQARRRIVCRYVVKQKEPGVKFCCYYACGMCVFPVDVDKNNECEVSFLTSDLKALTYGDEREFIKRTFLGCCTLSEEQIETTILSLLFVKKVTPCICSSSILLSISTIAAVCSSNVYLTEHGCSCLDRGCALYETYVSEEAVH